MKPSELLKKPESWCQLRLATDRHGNRVHPCSDLAECWCVSGAIERCFETRKEKEAAREKVREEATRRSVFVGVSPELWNDQVERTHAEVLDLLKAVGL